MTSHDEVLAAILASWSDVAGEWLDNLAGLAGLAGPAIATFSKVNPAAFYKSIIIAIVLAAVLLSICLSVGRLWFRRYQLSFGQGLFAAVAVLITAFSTFMFGAADYLKPALSAVIVTWQGSVKHDRQWTDEAFAEAYQQVQRLGIEDFSKSPPPSQGGHMIPLTHEESRLADAKSTIQSAAAHFVHAKPLLGRLIKAYQGLEIPAHDVKVAVDGFFATGKNIMPHEFAVDLCAVALEKLFESRMDGVITTCRVVLTFIPLLLWAVLLLWVARRAHNLIVIELVPAQSRRA